MNRKRIGFLTTSGTITAIAMVVIVAGVGFLWGGILFNPGPLNGKSGAVLGGVSSHAELTTQCSACHTPFWSPATISDRCASCHTDIPAQWANPATLHGNLHQNNPALACRNCHPEHKGVNASLTDMSRVTVNHQAFGYALAAHKVKADGISFTCTDCHVSGYTKFDQSVCATCHQQSQANFMPGHIQAYGSDCLNCHDGVDTYGHAFNHALLTFPLTGKHAQVSCAQCHTGEHTLAAMKATSAECSSCHAKNDPHQGQLGTDCKSCHTTDGWSPSTFDHNLASFKLTGKHASVACNGCHTDKIFKNTPTDCAACHAKDDAHGGQFGLSCGTCHTPTGWLPATFDHNLASFKLTGKHVNVACTSCHINNVFKGTPSNCYGCHAKNDAHNGQFGTDCGACHSTNGWKPATFDHNKFFPLTGGHAGLPCTSCHKSGSFGGLSTSCASCHSDPAFHAGLFAGTACSQCHSTTAWSPASYNGAHPGGCDGNCINHQGASCRDCHTVNLMTATCLKCHNSNNPGDGGGGGGGN